ncbi:hypothetical protein Fcan01_25734 [Folsomia candida]|uniref:Uncharacterized protein n=1 Tax=Folsomia candida TaxID=158441 RepID=A0A226D4Q1_FOLCA|nr:hypothetical protein Fcan01_25734 [Folsomia candida]
MTNMTILCLKSLSFLTIFTIFVLVIPDLSEATTLLDYLNSIVDIFSHCNLIIKITTKHIKLIPPHPVLIYLDDLQVPINHSEKFLFENVSFVRRLQIPKFCWTYIFPDMGANFRLSNLLNSPIFPPPSLSSYPIHLIWMVSGNQEKADEEMEKISEKVLSSKIYYLGSREFYFAQPSFKSVMHFYHLNLYYRQRTFVPGAFKKFGIITCDPKFTWECYKSIENATDKVALAFNKFSWVYSKWLNYEEDGVYTFNKKFIKMHKKHFQYIRNPDWMQVANESESLEEFMAYAILQEGLYNVTLSVKIYKKENFFFYGKIRMRYSPKHHQIVLVGSQSYSFLSCYGIKRENSYSVFANPFDMFIWGCILIVVFIFTLISVLVTQDCLVNLKMTIVTVAVVLEISINTRVVPSQIKYYFWLWIFSAMILTAFYKTIFTTEVILPYKRTPLWKHIYDLEEQGFQFLLPLKPDLQLAYDAYSKGTTVDSFYAFEFAQDIYDVAAYPGNFSRLVGYKKVANALVDGYPQNGGKTGNEVIPIWKELHYKLPFDLYSNLSRCEEKLAYLDKKENIKNIIPFLNDNKDGAVFMEGADGDFLLKQYGIQIDSTPRKNFVVNRMKFFMVLGIYKWWEDWFRMTRPNKLFPYYANWTRPKVGALERLDFGSKFTTTLKIWGICCGFCGVVGIMELAYEQWDYLRRVVKHASQIMTENS